MSFLSNNKRISEHMAPKNIAYWAPTTATGVTRNLEVYETHIEVAVTNSAVLTLPDVADACGNIYFIRMTYDGAGTDQTLTIAANGTPTFVGATIAAAKSDGATYVPPQLTAIGDYLTLYSNGIYWFILQDVTT